MNTVSIIDDLESQVPKSQRQVELERQICDLQKAFDYLIGRIIESGRVVNEVGDTGPIIAAEMFDAIEDSRAIKDGQKSTES